MDRTSAWPTADARGMSTPLSHVLSVAITTILVIGLVAGATGFLETQKERSATGELRLIGNRLAGELARIDALARDGDAASIAARHPDAVAGSSYTARLRHLGGSCADVATDTCLEVSADEYDASLVVPVHNETTLSLEPRGGGRFRLAAAGGGPTPQTDRRATELSPRVGIGGDVGTGPNVGVGASLSQTPIAEFTFSPGVPQSDSPIGFDATGSEDPDGTIATYEWDFEDDGTFSGTGATPTHTFASPGTYPVTLRVTDDTGRTNEVTRRVDVAGLQYDDNLTATAADGVTFTVTNRHAQPIEVERILIDPADPALDEVSEDSGGFSEEDDAPHEIEIDRGDDGSIDGFVDWAAGGFFGGSSLQIPAGGAIVEVYDPSRQSAFSDVRDGGDDVTLGVDETARITVQEFVTGPGPENEAFTFGVRYRIGSAVNSNVFNGTAVAP